MAVDLPNPESLLNPLFLSQDESRAFKSLTGHGKSSNMWGDQELTFGSVSSVSGLSESETCSEETGDDDYIAELTQQMAQYMFQEEDEQAVPGFASNKQRKTWSLATSPQSTLWSPFGSTQSREQSPPAMEDRGWDITAFHDEKQRLVGSVPETEHPQIRVVQFHKLKQEQVATKQLQRNSNKIRQQKQTEIQQAVAGSGTRAMFLGGSGHRSGSSGTGVFLPRGHRSNDPSESRKKLGCSRVVIPARVAQALKLHFDHVGVVSKPKSIINSNSDASLQHDNNSKDGKGRSAANHQLEMALPHEWTY